MSAMQEPRFLVMLPGQPTCTIDPSTVVCVRSTDEGIVVIHTSEGFAVPLRPEDGQTVDELHTMILETFAGHHEAMAELLTDEDVPAH